MPSLTWRGKPKPVSQPLSGTVPAILSTEAYIYPQGQGFPSIPENRLLLGDNLALMSALLSTHEGRIDLIYADPPFFTKRQYKTRIGRGEDSRKPKEWKLADGYHDKWADIEEYLNFLYPRLAVMHRLLSPTGTLYLHLDWHADAYGRLLLDEIFGHEHLLNEIIWVYHGPSPIRTAFNRKHDTILVYTKSDRYTFNADAVRKPYNPSTVKTFEASSKAGFGKVPNLARGKVPEDWWYFPVIARLHSERTGYPTQKPEALLERIILASSNPGDLVADFFCGSGTTPLVAAKNRRRFIAADVVWRAIHTTQVRLVNNANHPFTLERTQDSEWKVTRRNVPALTPKLSDGSIVLVSPPADLDYWELDPIWDGKTFRSIAQASRPTRSGKIPHALALPEIKSGRKVCVRAVMARGEQYQIEL
jgi:DNA modification methylase